MGNTEVIDIQEVLLITKGVPLNISKQNVTLYLFQKIIELKTKEQVGIINEDF